MIKFLVLGPFECQSANRPLNISGTLGRGLSATLLAAEGIPVAVDSLVSELLRTRPPAALGKT